MIVLVNLDNFFAVIYMDFHEIAVYTTFVASQKERDTSALSTPHRPLCMLIYYDVFSAHCNAPLDARKYMT